MQEIRAKLIKHFGENLLDIETVGEEKNEAYRITVLNKFRLNRIDIPHKRLRFRVVYVTKGDNFSNLFGNLRYHHIDFLILKIPYEWFELPKNRRAIIFQVIIEEWLKQFVKDLFKYQKKSKLNKKEFKEEIEDIKDILIDTFINNFKKSPKGRLRKDGMKILIYIHFFVNTGDILEALIRINKKEEKTLKWVFNTEENKKLYTVNNSIVFELYTLVANFLQVSYSQYLKWKKNRV
jgi:hypothetical protein